MLTGLNINGEPVKPSDHWNILANDIAVTDNVILKYNQNILSVDYAVMNFIKPGKNKSAYKLEGYDPNWKVTDRHAASFTNLPPGQYTLLIKACNNDGVWNPAPANLLITILPPPWKTWWAYSLYTIGFLLLLFTVIYFFASRAALRRKLRYEHLMNIKQQELHQMKMDFFTHISHEIRTPLTMIMGPVEMLQSSMTAKPANQKLLLTIKNNAERLLKLTNDLLEFRKADSGYTQLKIRPDNLIAFSQSVYAKFTGTADKKSIAYSFESEEENIEVYFDPHHIEIVLSNLLSNAMKFTPEGGRISVCVARNDHEVVEIMVRDNGIGIPHESQDKIFTHFYQADAGSLKHAGSGIGLAFSKSLVELHQGQLTFSSEHNTNTGGRETCFTVTLKLGKHHLNQNDLDL
jgi:signal transduction histidine kinase